MVLLYLSVTARVVIGQFSGLYSPVRSLKFKAVFVAKMFWDLSPSVLNVLASKSLKLSFTSNFVY